MTECGLLVGGVLLILGVALGFTHYLVDAQFPDQMVAGATETVKSRWLFLLGLNVVLLFVGGLVEIYAAIVVVAETTGRPGFVVPGLSAAVVAELVMGRMSVTAYQQRREPGMAEPGTTELGMGDPEDAPDG